ncbi:hypothetical protein EC843_10182 [Buttiauxella sp. JUb87]|uniref:hypothetical protein n=1 Tax=unclassified Buttiauxella TaxID=2634062 RepID=UPI00105C62B4|nr:MULTISPECIES: hypothetical protein [unclassified Buttiauxella]TDN54041.1 hypothetical protein EC843_10182 [Buttiauxella sp. JUb87]
MPLTNNRGTSNSRPSSLHVVTGKIMYSRKATEEGWLKVKLDNGNFDFLHENVKLIVKGEKNGRLYLLVASDKSNLIGQTISLQQENALKYLSSKGPMQKSASIKVEYVGKPVKTTSRFKGDLIQQFANLYVNGSIIKVTLNSLWPPKYSYSPIPAGVHKLMSPDNSHAKNAPTDWYRKAFSPGVITCNDIWFPIELNGEGGNSSRYIHLGNLSEGCVTVYDVEKWNVVYDYLINHRIPGTKGMYVGEITVVT